MAQWAPSRPSPIYHTFPAGADMSVEEWVAKMLAEAPEPSEAKKRRLALLLADEPVDNKVPFRLKNSVVPGDLDKPPFREFGDDQPAAV